MRKRKVNVQAIAEKARCTDNVLAGVTGPCTQAELFRLGMYYPKIPFVYHVAVIKLYNYRKRDYTARAYIFSDNSVYISTPSNHTDEVWVSKHDFETMTGISLAPDWSTGSW